MRVLRSLARSLLVRTASVRLTGVPTLRPPTLRPERSVGHRQGDRPPPRPRARPSRLLASSLLLAACEGPGWHLAANEPGAAIYLDGRYVGTGVADVRYRFYGTSSVTVVPPPRQSVDEDVRAPVTTAVRLDPPAPKWLFPLDFFLEVGRRGVRSASPAEALVPLPAPETTLAAGTRPPQAEALRARAQTAEKER